MHVLIPRAASPVISHGVELLELLHFYRNLGLWQSRTNRANLSGGARFQPCRKSNPAVEWLKTVETPNEGKVGLRLDELTALLHHSFVGA